MKTPAFISNKQVTFPLYALIFFIICAVVIISLKQEPEKNDQTRKAPLVSVDPVEFGSLQVQVDSQGIFNPKYQTDLVAQVSGVVVELSPAFVRGGIVTKGELLAQIDPFDYEVQLQDAKAKLASAEAALILERAQGKVAQAEWEKISDTLPTDLSLRKPQLEQAQANVKAAEAGLKQATKNLERTRIIAPFNALVTLRSVSLGSYIGTGANLGHLYDIASGEVRLPIASKEQQFLLNNGIDASVTLTADSAGALRDWHAKIVRTEGIVDDSNRMVYLVAELQDPYLQQATTNNPHPATLPFGTYVNAKIDGIHYQSAATLPRHLVEKGQVAVYEDGKLVFRQVDIARTEGANVIVTNGLHSGEKIVTSALDFPVEGMELELLDDSIPPADTNQSDIVAEIQ